MMEKYIIKIVIEDENGDGECASAFAWEETNIKWKQQAHHYVLRPCA
jgi:hypothetical protein